jgi:hypothetical protein
LLGASDVVTQERVRKAPDCGEAAIAGHSAVVALGFNVLEERENDIGAQVVQAQLVCTITRSNNAGCRIPPNASGRS